MRHCNATIEVGRCPGHLGKFDDCVAEAVYELTLSGDADETTGDGDFDGHFALVILRDPEATWINPDGSDRRQVMVPHGNYVLHTASSGAVSLWTYDEEADAREEFDHYDQRHQFWRRGCDYGRPEDHVGCVNYDECRQAGHSDT